MSNQIDSLFGRSHDSFLARLRRATRIRQKQTLVAKAVHGLTVLIRIKEKETLLLRELRERLRDWNEDLKAGIDLDPKKAAHILKENR